jgi:hypothetical protein
MTARELTNDEARHLMEIVNRNPFRPANSAVEERLLGLGLIVFRVGGPVATQRGHISCLLAPTR